jgi:hypothetical protein
MKSPLHEQSLGCSRFEASGPQVIFYELGYLNVQEH